MPEDIVIEDDTVPFEFFDTSFPEEGAIVGVGVDLFAPELDFEVALDDWIWGFMLMDSIPSLITSKKFVVHRQ